MIRRVLPLSTFLASCVVALAAMWSVRDDRLDPPPVDPGLWQSWWSSREAIDAVASCGRLVATVALGYLVAATLIHVAALISRNEALGRVTSHLSPAPVAALAVAAVLGSTPVAGASSSHSPGLSDPPQPRPAAPPVMRMIDDDNDSHSPPPASTAPITEPVTTTSTSSGPATTTVTSAMTTTGAAGATGRPTTPIPPNTAARSRAMDPRAGSEAEDEAIQRIEYTVRPGDNFWEVARRRVRLAVGAEPSEEQVRDYWLELVAINESRLVEPGNPDLLLPGQTLRLPA